MVTDSRTQARPDALRSLNRPRPVQVEARTTRRGIARPEVIIDANRRERVEEVEEHWSIDDEWWLGRPIQRRYYRVRLEAGHIRTIFYDFVQGRWFSQR